MYAFTERPLENTLICILDIGQTALALVKPILFGSIGDVRVKSKTFSKVFFNIPLITAYLYEIFIEILQIHNNHQESVSESHIKGKK